jgi:hypothetical protein
MIGSDRQRTHPFVSEHRLVLEIMYIEIYIHEHKSSLIALRLVLPITLIILHFIFPGGSQTLITPTHRPNANITHKH